MKGRKPPWPSGRRWSGLPAWGWLAQKLSSTTLLFSSTQRCISGLRQPVVRARATEASSGAATFLDRFIEDSETYFRGGSPILREVCDGRSGRHPPSDTFLE